MLRLFIAALVSMLASSSYIAARTGIYRVRVKTPGL